LKTKVTPSAPGPASGQENAHEQERTAVKRYEQPRIIPVASASIGNVRFHIAFGQDCRNVRFVPGQFQLKDRGRSKTLHWKGRIATSVKVVFRLNQKTTNYQGGYQQHCRGEAQFFAC
jgi:hypothetical protein